MQKWLAQCLTVAAIAVAVSAYTSRRPPDPAIDAALITRLLEQQEAANKNIAKALEAVARSQQLQADRDRRMINELTRQGELIDDLRRTQEPEDDDNSEQDSR